jgi:hypothetical protein
MYNHPPLPEGWKIKDGRLIDAEKYSRNIVDSYGKIDYDTVATILENYGYPYLAKRWILSPTEARAKELRDILSRIITIFNYELCLNHIPLMNEALTILKETEETDTTTEED